MLPTIEVRNSPFCINYHKKNSSKNDKPTNLSSRNIFHSTSKMLSPAISSNIELIVCTACGSTNVKSFSTNA